MEGNSPRVLSFCFDKKISTAVQELSIIVLSNNQPRDQTQTNALKKRPQQKAAHTEPERERQRERQRETARQMMEKHR